MYGITRHPKSPRLSQKWSKAWDPEAYLDSQVAGNNRPLHPKVDQYWFKVAHNSEPLALQVGVLLKDAGSIPEPEPEQGYEGDLHRNH